MDSTPEYQPQKLSREQFMMLTMGLTTLDEITQKRLDRELRYLQGKLQCAYERQYATLSDRALFVEFRQSHGWLNEDYGVVTGEAKARWWAIRKVMATRPHVERVSERRRNRNELARVNRGQSKAKNR